MLKDMFKKADLILLAVLLIGGLAASFAVARSSHDGSRVVIKAGGKVCGEYSTAEERRLIIRTDRDGASVSDISDDGSESENDSGQDRASSSFAQSSYGYNIIDIKDGQVSMTEADCHNQVCVHHKPIEKNGQSIICLPHKVVVEIVSSKGEGDYDTLAQ